MQGARYSCAPPQAFYQRHKRVPRMAVRIYHIDRSAQLSHQASGFWPKYSGPVESPD